MAARTPRAAVEDVLRQLTPIARCVTGQPLHAIGQHTTPQNPVSIAFLPLLKPVPLRVYPGQARIELVIKHDLSIARLDAHRKGFQAITTAYSYRILDRRGNEVLAYHWHPQSASRVITPHLHLSHQVHPIIGDPHERSIPIADMHIATGLVLLSDVVRLLIAEFGVEPRREDWESILETVLQESASPS